MKQPVPATPPGQAARRRRPRRSAEEITNRLIDAAVEEFAANGYARARTAAIARRAGAVEPLLFKYFGSKANLFQRAIFETLDRNYTNFISTHEPEPEGRAGWMEQATEYVGQQQDFLRKNSRMFMSLIVQETFDSEGVEGLDGMNGLQEFLDKMSAFTDARLSGKTGTDSKLVARISFASLLACVLFRDWLFPGEIATEQKIKAAVIDFILKGADVYPKADESAGNGEEARSPNRRSGTKRSRQSNPG